MLSAAVVCPRGAGNWRHQAFVSRSIIGWSGRLFRPDIANSALKSSLSVCRPTLSVVAMTFLQFLDWESRCQTDSAGRMNVFCNVLRIALSCQPPRIPHAFPSLAVQARPWLVLRKCWQLELWRTLEDVFSQYWPPAASAEVDGRLVDVLPLRWRERKSHGGRGLASAQRPEPPDFACDSSRASVSSELYCL